MPYWIWMCRNQRAVRLMKCLLRSPGAGAALYSRNHSISWTFRSLHFRWPDRLRRPWLLSAKQLLRKSSLPGFAWSPWPYSAQPTTFLSASSKALLRPNQIPDREGKHSCNPRRCLIWEQVSFLLEKDFSEHWELQWNYLTRKTSDTWITEFFTGDQKILQRIASV